MYITISAVTETTAVTEDQFKKWPSSKKSAWLKAHPHSQFGKKPVPATPKPKPTSSGGKFKLDQKHLAKLPKYMQKEVEELAQKSHTPEGSEALMDHLKKGLRISSKSSRAAHQALLDAVKAHRRAAGHGELKVPSDPAKKHPVYQDTVQALRDAGIDPKSPAGKKAIEREIEEYKKATGR